jgi:hypothetical protein
MSIIYTAINRVSENIKAACTEAGGSPGVYLVCTRALHPEFFHLGEILREIASGFYLPQSTQKEKY